MADNAQDKAIEAIDAFIASAEIDKSDSNWKTKLPKPSIVDFEAGTDYFWDIETSGSAGSAAGIGLTTDRMQDRQTFLDAGWDFVDEVDNGLHEIWRMPDEGGYPELDFFSESPRFRLSGQGTADDPYLTVFSH